jgi:thioredoxin reductase
VLLCDKGHPRNERSRGLHGYLTRDGIAPLELLRIGREELQQYGIATEPVAVIGVSRAGAGFDVQLEGGRRVTSQTVLLATGVRDVPPDIPGIAECYGITVHHCPYCDGWETRDKRIAVLAAGATPVGLALSLKTWSQRIVVATHGLSIRAAHRRQLAQECIPVYDGRVARIDHENGHARQLVFESGETLPCDSIFFAAPQAPQSDLARNIGCEFTHRGTVKTDLLGHTCVPGLYVAGDASRDVQFAIVAAAEGAKAGVAINKALQARSGRAAETGNGRESVRALAAAGDDAPARASER